MTENQLSSNMSIQEDVLKLRVENEQIKAKLRAIKTCHFNGCIGCTHKSCEVEE